MNTSYLLSNCMLLAASCLLAYAAFRARKPSDRLVATIEFGIWVFFAVILAVYMNLGALPALLGHPSAHLLSANVVTWCLTTIAATALLLLRNLAPPLIHDIGQLSVAFAGRIRRQPWIMVSLLLIALTLGGGAWRILAFPPHVNDVMASHLVPVPTWYQQSTMPVTIPVNHGWPQFLVNAEFQGSSLFNLWGFWFTNNIMLVDLFPLLLTLAITCSIFRFLRSLCINHDAAMLFTAAIICCPIVILHIHTCKNYTSYIYPWVSAAMLLAGNLKRHHVRELAILCAPLAIAWSNKIVASFTLPAMLFIYLAVRLYSGSLRRQARTRQELVLTILLASLACCLTSWFWIYRNYRNDGAYYYRFADHKMGISHNEVIKRDQAKSNLPFAGNFKLLRKNLYAYPHRVRDLPYSLRWHPHLLKYTVDGWKISNFGAIYFSFGQVMLLAFLFVFCRRRLLPARHLALWFLVAVAAVSLLMHWCMYFNEYSYRSHMFLPLMLLPVGLYTLYLLAQRRIKVWLRILLITTMLYHLIACSYTETTCTAKRLMIQNLPLRQRAVSLYYNSNWWPSTNGSQLLPTAGRLGCLTKGFLFPFNDPDWQRKLTVIPSDDSDPAAAAKLFWRMIDVNDFDFVFIDPNAKNYAFSPLRLSPIPGTTYMTIRNRHWRIPTAVNSRINSPETH